jgi:hypothetical protein
MCLVTVIEINDLNKHRYENKNFTVSVDGWSKRRPVHRTGPRLIIDIAVPDCMCNTCVRRFESIIISMRDRKVDYEVGSWNKSCSVCFIQPEGTADEEICKLLSEKLGIPVSDLRPEAL